MRELWDEFLFGIQRQPDGKWARDENWFSLAWMWVIRVSLVLMVLCALVLAIF